jgi:hypothetical protein
MPKQKAATDLKVFIVRRKSQCAECGEALGSQAWITLEDERGARCLTCADLDHLVFLPAGDTALTRRSREHSRLCAVVLKWSRTRKRYERQGLLVENEALEVAEQECRADEKQRATRRAQSAARRDELDREYVQQFARRIRERYPQCPAKREERIAEHACRKYSGRVGRSAAAKDLTEEAVDLAVRAHIRHVETPYDALLMTGHSRRAARAKTAPEVTEVAGRWRGHGLN